MYYEIGDENKNQKNIKFKKILALLVSIWFLTF